MDHSVLWWDVCVLVGGVGLYLFLSEAWTTQARIAVFGILAVGITHIIHLGVRTVFTHLYELKSTIESLHREVKDLRKEIRKLRDPSLPEEKDEVTSPKNHKKKQKGASTDSGSMWLNAGVSKGPLSFLRQCIGPLFLMLSTPLLVLFVFHTIIKLDGTFVSLYKEMTTMGVKEWFLYAVPYPFDPQVWNIIGIYMAVEAVIMRVLPGKTFYGPVTPAGNQPKYKANGMQAFLLSILLFALGVYFNLFSGAIIYDNFPGILSAINVFALSFCLGLYLKGIIAPSTTDCGASGNGVIFDFYWGLELYPNVLGWDIKQLINCRWSMMVWPLAIISFACKQYETYGYVSDSMFISVALQLVYIAKFFWWETGYLASMDIMHDRAGYYIIWGIMCLLPCIYTCHTLFLVSRPVTLGPWLGGGVLLLGLISVWINYDIDNQRGYFRSQGGKCKIWGREAKYIEAKYTTETGEKKTSLLLASGWWGFSRHFHYIPELTAAFLWGVPFAAPDHAIPYLYTVFLFFLLLDRTWRVDARCHDKYGKAWDSYCKLVPYRLVPYLF